MELGHFAHEAGRVGREPDPASTNPGAPSAGPSCEVATTKAFADPLHVGRPNIGDRSAFYQLMDEMFDRGWLSNNGTLVQHFEKAVADYLGVRHCVAVCNGTMGLQVAIRALDLKGEVIVPSYTFIATAHALRWLGLTPVFADIDARSHALDPVSVARVITPRTSAVLGVHLWGRAAPIDALRTIADDHGLKLLFDAAHAFGCSYRQRMIGNFGQCEIMSFHATKFFNTFEGGAITTNDDQLADRLRRMRNFGFVGVDNVQDDGINGKMIEPAAAMGLVNLREIDRLVAINRRNQQAYRRGLANIPGLSLLGFDENERNNFQYVVLELDAECPSTRDQLVQALQAHNVLARRYFWPGCHRMEPYRTLNPNDDDKLPNTLRVAARTLALPNGNAVVEADIETICDIIRSVRS